MRNAWRKIYYTVLLVWTLLIIFPMPEQKSHAAWTEPPWPTETNRAKAFLAFQQAASSLWEKAIAATDDPNPTNIVTDPSTYTNRAAVWSYTTNLKAEIVFVLQNYYWCNTNLATINAGGDLTFDSVWLAHCATGRYYAYPPRIYTSSSGPMTSSVLSATNVAADPAYFSKTARAGSTTSSNGIMPTRDLLNEMVWLWQTNGFSTSSFVVTTYITTNKTVIIGPPKITNWTEEAWSTNLSDHDVTGSRDWTDNGGDCSHDPGEDCGPTNCTASNPSGSGDQTVDGFCAWDDTNSVQTGTSVVTNSTYSARINFACYEEIYTETNVSTVSYTANIISNDTFCNYVANYDGSNTIDVLNKGYTLMQEYLHKWYTWSAGTLDWNELTSNYAATVDLVMAREQTDVGVFSTLLPLPWYDVDYQDTNEACANTNAAAFANPPWIACCGIPGGGDTRIQKRWQPLVVNTGSSNLTYIVTNKYVTTCARVHDESSKAVSATGMVFTLGIDDFYKGVGGDVDNGIDSDWNTSEGLSCSATLQDEHITNVPPAIIDNDASGTHDVVFLQQNHIEVENYNYVAGPLGVILKFNVGGGFGYVADSGWDDRLFLPDEWYVAPRYIDSIRRRETEMILN